MNDFFIYLLKANIFITALYIVYYTVLRKLTFFKANRIFFLLSIIASITIPLFNIDIAQSNIAIAYQDSMVLEPFINEAPYFQNQNSYVSTNSFQSVDIAMLLYFLIAAFFLTKVVTNLWSIRRFKCNSEKTTIDSYNIFWHDNNYAFSFFRSLFLPISIKGSDELATILKHEKAHARQLHSIDLVLVELFAALLWFNPFVYFLKRSMKQLHEFIADKEVINSGTKSLEYITGLQQEFLRNYNTGLVANFKTKSIKRRLIMITKNNSKKTNLFKYAVIAPIVVALTIFINVKDLSSSNIELRDGISFDLDKAPSIYPVDKKYNVVAGFGHRKNPITKKMQMHTGVDIPAPEGTDIYATAEGIVEKAEFKKGWGNLIVISHGKVYKTYYAHLKGFDVKVGEKVNKGDIIGYVGDTGMSTAPHLHYEVSKNGKKMDPAQYF